MLTASGLSVLTCTFRYSCRRVQNVASRFTHRLYSTDALSIPKADHEDKVYPEKLSKIVSDISQLTLLEVADLNELLKKTLNIPDAPAMSMGMMPGMMQAAPKEEEEEVQAVQVQTSFTLKITNFEPTKKVALIKHCKTIMEGMNLVQAKKFVEDLPAVVRKDCAKDEVDKLQEALKEVGAESVIE